MLSNSWPGCQLEEEGRGAGRWAEARQPVSWQMPGFKSRLLPLESVPADESLEPRVGSKR